MQKNKGSSDVFVACQEDHLAQQLVAFTITMWSHQQTTAAEATLTDAKVAGAEKTLSNNSFDIT